MIDLIIIVMGWLAVVSLNGGIRDNRRRLDSLEKRLKRQTKQNTMSDSSKADKDGVKIEEA